MSRTKPVMQPPHRQVAQVQAQVLEALERAAAAHDPHTVLEVLSRGHDDDPAGLSVLLAELGLDTPADLVSLLQLLTASASYASLTWSRALPIANGQPYSAEDVLRAAWVDARFRQL